MLFRSLEPSLNPEARLAVQVPDGIFDPYRMVASFVATAQANGAIVKTQCRVTGFVMRGDRVAAAKVINDVTRRTEEIRGDLFVNATGPWAARVGALAGVSVPVVPSAGVMVALEKRLCHMVINRLRRPGDGDILVPQRLTTLLGTTSWKTEELDPVPVPREHIERLVLEGAKLIPACRTAPIKTAFSSARPLISGNLEGDAREVSRGFQVIDHGRLQNVHGLLTVAGGKTTTSRAMGEHVGDWICAITGRAIPCRTASAPLLPYYRYRVGASHHVGAGGSYT